MAASTGPIIATGAITYANAVIGNGKSWDSELIVPVATAIAVGIAALLEHAAGPLVVGIAWISLVTSLLIKPKSGNSAVTNLTKLTGL